MAKCTRRLNSNLHLNTTNAPNGGTNALYAKISHIPDRDTYPYQILKNEFEEKKKNYKKWGICCLLLASLKKQAMPLNSYLIVFLPIKRFSSCQSFSILLVFLRSSVYYTIRKCIHRVLLFVIKIVVVVHLMTTAIWATRATFTSLRQKIKKK